MDEEEDGELYGQEAEFSGSTQPSYLQERCVVVNVFFLQIHAEYLIYEGFAPEQMIHVETVVFI